MNPPSPTAEQTSEKLKVVVIGGSGLIGTQVVRRLRAMGHNAQSASPSSGVNTLTGAGLPEALVGSQVVVDVSNSPSFEDQVAMSFFETARRNIAAAEKAAGVQHHVALSVVGTERLQDSGYFRAKLRQETLIREAGIPYTIVRATQFFEFINAIAQSSVQGDEVRPAAGLFEPMAATDVAEAVTKAALASPVNSLVEIGGPERLSLTEAVQQFLVAQKDPRSVTEDPSAFYFGLEVANGSLCAGEHAWRSPTRLADWLQQNANA